MKVDLVITLAENENLNTKSVDFLAKKEIILRYFFRGISRYLTWISTVYFIVPDNYEVPTWLQNITIIRNSTITNTIDIPELSDNYIMLDTSTFIVGDIKPEDLFNEGKLKVKCNCEKPQQINSESQQVYQNYQKFIENTLDTPYILRPIKGLLPYSKLLVNAQITDFTSYYYWGSTIDKVILSTNSISIATYPIDSYWAGIIKYDLLNNKTRQVVCLSSEYSLEKKLHIDAEAWILEALKVRVGPQPCKYENN